MCDKCFEVENFNFIVSHSLSLPLRLSLSLRHSNTNAVASSLFCRYNNIFNLVFECLEIGNEI